jgi:ribonuclease P protein component
MGLPKGVRLARAADFARVRAEGRSYPGRYLLLSIVAAPDIQGWKCGIITPRRLGTAVTRNRIRRRLRELVRADAARLRQGQWLVIVARWRCPQASFAEIKQDWQAAAGRANLFV